MKSSPFYMFRPEALSQLFWVLAIMFVACSVWIVWMDSFLKNDLAPRGIVSFELAATKDKSQVIIDSWAAIMPIAFLVQGVDYLYLLVYPLFLSLACVLLGRSLAGRWQRAGCFIAWAVLLAAPLDAVENYALIKQLLHGATHYYAQLAFWCATPKFALIVLTLLFILLACAVKFKRRFMV